MSIAPSVPRPSAAGQGVDNQVLGFHSVTEKFTHTIDNITIAIRDGFVPNRPSRQGSFSSSASSDNASQISFQASEASSATSLSPGSDRGLDSYDEQNSNTIGRLPGQDSLAAARRFYHETVVEGVVSGFPDSEGKNPRCVISQLGLIKLEKPVADNDNAQTSFWPPTAFYGDPAKQTVHSTTISLQTNSRRSSTSHQWRKPSLVRQSDRRENFVENLVGCSAALVACIWPSSSAPRTAMSTAGTADPIIPLRTFIRETLRRSHSSYSTLQVTLYYIVLLRLEGNTVPSPREPARTRALQCGRRMFLAALMLASKYLQDRNFSARAWSKISGLRTPEITHNELVFLKAIDWKLHMKQDRFCSWTNIVEQCTTSIRCNPCGTNPWSEVLGYMLNGSSCEDVDAAMSLHHVSGTHTYQSQLSMLEPQLEAAKMDIAPSPTYNHVCRSNVQAYGPSCEDTSPQQPLDFASIHKAMYPSRFAMPSNSQTRLDASIPGTINESDGSPISGQAQNHDYCGIPSTLTSKYKSEIWSSSADERNEPSAGRVWGTAPPAPVLGRNLSTPQIQPLCSSACAPAAGSKTSDHCREPGTGQISNLGTGTPGTQSPRLRCFCRDVDEAAQNCALSLVRACEYPTPSSTADNTLSDVSSDMMDLTTIAGDSAEVNHGSLPFRPLAMALAKLPVEAEAAALSKVLRRTKKSTEARARRKRKHGRSSPQDKTDVGHCASKRICSVEKAPMQLNGRKVRCVVPNANVTGVPLDIAELPLLQKWEMNKMSWERDHGRKQARPARPLNGEENE